MNIGILGAGTLGKSVARLLVRLGHSVLLGSKDASRVEALAKSFGAGATEGTYAQAAAFSNVILIATRWEDTAEVIKQAGPWQDKILIDCTNPETLDGRAPLIGHTSSGAEEIAKKAVDAKVVKAFNHVYAEVLDEGPVFSDQNASVFYCGDYPCAKQTVADLIRQCGFDPVDVGPLESARYLEPVAFLMVQLVRIKEIPPSTIALKLLRREENTRIP